MEEIEKLRSWFRMNGQMDFEINGKGKGEFITYKCADIEEIFDKTLSKFKKLTIPDVVKCNCKIPHPQMKVSENGISGYCAKCIKPL